MRPTIRRAAAGAVLAVVATALTLPAMARDDLVACEKRAPGAIDARRKDGWFKIRVPRHVAGEGPDQVVSYATSPGRVNTMYSTNGHVIKVTADAGCSWSTIFTGNYPQPPPPGGDGVDVDVFTHVVAPDNASLWAAVYDDNHGVPKPRVYVLNVSDPSNPAPEQTTVDNGLAPVGIPVALDVTPGLSANAYVVVEVPVPDDATQGTEPSRQLFTTYVADTSTPPEATPVGGLVGTVWKRMTLPDGFGAVQGVKAISNRVAVVWSANKYAVTQNAIADEIDWEVGDFGSGQVVTAAVDGERVLFAVKTNQGTSGVWVDATTGKIVGTQSFPAAPTSITFGRRNGVLAMSGPGGTYGYDVGLEKWLKITPQGAKPLGQLFMANGFTTRYLIGFDGSAFYRFDTFDDAELFRAPPPLTLGDFNMGTVPRSTLTGLVLDPVQQTVVVKPGELHHEPVKLKVPPDPNKLDVYFLMDTTGSMGASINGLKASVLEIAGGLRQLLDQPKEVCFGVGDFKDASGPGGAATSGGNLSYVYHARQKIICEQDKTLPKIRVALGGMSAIVGGDDPEAQTLALSQAVLGTGNDNPNLYVAPDQDAGFRPDALKVIVLISDTNMHDGGSYPTKDSAIDVLNSAEVKVVGVHALNKDVEAAYADFKDIAIGTRTFAPAEGVDCDSDGKFNPKIDLKPGAPLVCQTDGGQPNIGGAVKGLLLGVEDPGTISVMVADEGEVVQQKLLTEPTAALRNLKRESHLDFTLPLMCTKKQDGKDFSVLLQPTVRGKFKNPLGEILVKCRAPVIVPPPVIPPEPVLEVVKPRPRPPQAMAIQPPPQPPAMTNVNLNAGFSQQEEQQFQLATVGQDASEAEEAEEVELAMTGLDRAARDMPAAAAMLTGATLLSSAAGLAYRRRLRTQRATGVRYARNRF